MSESKTSNSKAVVAEKLGVVLEFKFRLHTAPPHTKSAFCDHRRILPADSEIDLRIHTVASIQKRPGTTSAEPCLFFVRPFPQ